MWVGLPVNSSVMFDIRIDLLRSYISGYQSAEENDVEGAAFFQWLIDIKQEFPTQGWVKKYLDDCDGDHIRAISKFWSFLHEYLLDTKPHWLLALNSNPLPSGIKNGAGVPASLDIRNEKHVELLRGS